MNILTFDIEEWYIEQNFNGARAERYACFDSLLGKILDLLDEKETKATFFCLGKIASDFPEVVKQIDSRGHEIGCHSNEHLWLTKMTPNELRNDTKEALESLENVCGKKVVSYRAPAFSIGEKNPWAIEILAECGIERDASIFPAVRDFGGFASFAEKDPCIVSYQGAEIKEFPICTMHLLGKETAYSGGGYFRLLPYGMVNRQMQRSNYTICYFHIGDLIDAPKRMMSKENYETYYREPGTFSNRLKRYVKSSLGRGNTFEKMGRLIKENSFVSLEKADEVIDWESRNRKILG